MSDKAQTFPSSRRARGATQGEQAVKQPRSASLIAGCDGRECGREVEFQLRCHRVKKASGLKRSAAEVQTLRRSCQTRMPRSNRPCSASATRMRAVDEPETLRAKVETMRMHNRRFHRDQQTMENQHERSTAAQQALKRWCYA